MLGDGGQARCSGRRCADVSGGSCSACLVIDRVGVGYRVCERVLASIPTRCDYVPITYILATSGRKVFGDWEFRLIVSAARLQIHMRTGAAAFSDCHNVRWMPRHSGFVVGEVPPCGGTLGGSYKHPWRPGSGCTPGLSQRSAVEPPAAAGSSSVWVYQSRPWSAKMSVYACSVERPFIELGRPTPCRKGVTYAARAFLRALLNFLSDSSWASIFPRRCRTTGHTAHRVDLRQHFFFGFTLVNVVAVTFAMKLLDLTVRSLPRT